MEYVCTDLHPFGCMIAAPLPDMPLQAVPVPSLRKLVQRKHLLLLRGFSAPATAEALVSYCELWGRIALWPFGKVLELVRHDAPDDHVFDHSAMPLHWDGMYRPQVPELQIFQCLSAPLPAAGGRTLFSHSARALREVPSAVREQWKRVTGRYVRRSAHYDSHTEAPLVNLHPSQHFGVIRYCEPDPVGDMHYLNPSDIDFVGMDDEGGEQMHRSLAAALRAPSCLLAHGWETGDVLVADNYTLLHGREAFTTGAPRHLRRVHVLGNPPLDNPHLVRTS